MQIQESQTSDRADRLRVGVTGHRDERLGNGNLATLRLRIRNVMIGISRIGCAVTVISPLAEGADQLAAEEAIEAGYRLECPLPFPREEYALDFGDGAPVQAFRSLLARAAVVDELPGTRLSPDAERAAYAAVGARVLDDADLLLAVWDGQEARGAGGTAEVVALAKARGMPIIWVDAAAPHPVKVVAGQDAACAGLSERLRMVMSEQIEQR